MQSIPTWRPEPEPVRIRCQLITKGPQSNELIVQFKIDGDEFTAFVPEQFVDQLNKTLAGFIVADFGDSWLIDIPSETLTSGSRIRVPQTEKQSVIMLAA